MPYHDIGICYYKKELAFTANIIIFQHSCQPQKKTSSSSSALKII